MRSKAKACFLLLLMGTVEVMAQTSTNEDPFPPVSSCADTAKPVKSTSEAQPNPVLRSSCRQILERGESVGSGVYLVDFDGTGSLASTKVYCDMISDGGGWTLLMNQVPSERLQYAFCTINPQNLGSLTKTYRLGSDVVRAIRPTVAWVLTDDYNRVYFKPSCVVAWENSLLNQPLGACSQGFTSSSFATTVSAVTTLNGSMGIGQNNYGGYCSIRAFMYSEDPSVPPGAAWSCNGTTSQTIRLWFR